MHSLSFSDTDGVKGGAAFSEEHSLQNETDSGAEGARAEAEGAEQAAALARVRRDVVTVSGMQAAARAAWALSDVACIYPITPASHMAEQFCAWESAGRRNVFGRVVACRELQSEKGAAGAMHGALQAGALGVTFTASQGLLLMLPNLYKMAGQLLPGVIHVTGRALSSHALSIFGDHQDVMAVRGAGCIMLASGSVQECADLSWVAHLSAVDASLPVVHFFDGFRTSDEVCTIEQLGMDGEGAAGEAGEGDPPLVRQSHDLWDGLAGGACGGEGRLPWPICPEDHVTNCRREEYGLEPPLSGEARGGEGAAGVGRALLNWENVASFRRRGLNPARPDARGMAQSSDVYFQAREASAPWHAAAPGVVAANMRKVSAACGRTYRLFDYAGHPQATMVVVCMGSGVRVVEEVVARRAARGERVGLVKVRLYRPFDTRAFLAALPESARVVCALDRTKEPGSAGEPLLADVALALAAGGRARRDVQLIGGRYGLASKEFAPPHAEAVLANMELAGAVGCKQRFTVGIDDDVSGSSLPVADGSECARVAAAKNGEGAPPDQEETPAYEAVFYGFGSDGTVGAVKQLAQLLAGEVRGGEGGLPWPICPEDHVINCRREEYGLEPPLSGEARGCEGAAAGGAGEPPSPAQQRWAQAYSWFDSKKSGGVTVSHLRLGVNRAQVDRPYQITSANYVACHNATYVARGLPLTERLAPGGVFVLNAPLDNQPPEQVIPSPLALELQRLGARVYVVDAAAVAAACGLGGRVNLIMAAAFCKLSGAVDFAWALPALKDAARQMYASKGAGVVEANIRALDQVEAAIFSVELKSEGPAGNPTCPISGAPSISAQAAGAAHAPSPAACAPATPCAQPAQARVAAQMDRLGGDALPVSAFRADGFAPTGLSKFEKRQVAGAIPEWDAAKCVQCFQCSFVCSHAAIRPVLLDAREVDAAPAAFATANARHKAIAAAGLSMRIQVYPQDCTGCGACATNCPAPGKALRMLPVNSQLNQQISNLDFAQNHVAAKANPLDKFTVAGSQLERPLMEFSAACAGCGETPYVKLLTQLFGPRLVIANATGCSSIWGGYAPASPYCTDAHGRGPAWASSLFEDNAEFAYGIKLGLDVLAAGKTPGQTLTQDSEGPAGEAGEGMPGGRDNSSAQLSRGFCGTVGPRCSPTRSACNNDTPHKVTAGNSTCPISGTPSTPTQAPAAPDAAPTVWCIGGDGWAFDIDFDGVDQVLSSGANVNLLVLDTEGYSNTGGQTSKATQRSAANAFSLGGKRTPRKRLAAMLATYENAYVAQVCLGASGQQLVRALREAESFPGPSLVVALCPCIAWGIRGGMAGALRTSRLAVESGYWQLWRRDPRRAERGLPPLVIDMVANGQQAPAAAGAAAAADVGAGAEEPSPLQEFLDCQTRFTRLTRSSPATAARLQAELAKDIARVQNALEAAAKTSIW